MGSISLLLCIVFFFLFFSTSTFLHFNSHLTGGPWNLKKNIVESRTTDIGFVVEEQERDDQKVSGEDNVGGGGGGGGLRFLSMEKFRILLGLHSSKHKTHAFSPAPAPTGEPPAPSPSPVPSFRHPYIYSSSPFPRPSFIPPMQDEGIQQENGSSSSRAERIVIAIGVSAGATLVTLGLTAALLCHRFRRDRKKRPAKTMSVSGGFRGANEPNHSSSAHKVRSTSTTELLYLNPVPLLQEQDLTVSCPEKVVLNNVESKSPEGADEDGDGDIFHSVCNSHCSTARSSDASEANVKFLSPDSTLQTSAQLSPTKSPILLNSESYPSRSLECSKTEESPSQCTTSNARHSSPSHHIVVTPLAPINLKEPNGSAMVEEKISVTSNLNAFPDVSRNTLSSSTPVSNGTVPKPPPPPLPPSAPFLPPQFKHGFGSSKPAPPPPPVSIQPSPKKETHTGKTPPSIQPSPSPLPLPLEKKTSTGKPPPPPSSQFQPPVTVGKDGTPLPKLKALHWDKVRAAPDQSMVWNKIRSSSFELDEQMIESLFGYNMQSSVRTEEAMTKNSHPSKHVLEPQRLQNLTILLKALNATVEQVCDALARGSGLSAQQLEVLIKMAPTNEEAIKLSNYDGDINELAPAEKFIKAILETTFSFPKIEVMLYRETFEDEVALLKNSFVMLEEACKELRSSRLFLRVLEAVLKAGNRMNVGTMRGGARAFKLDALLKLADVKGTDGKTTLLHFVVQEVIRSEGAVAMEKGEKTLTSSSEEKEDDHRAMGLELLSGLSTELCNVKKTAGTDLDMLATSVSNLSNGIVKLKPLIDNGLSTDSRSLSFVQLMDSFRKDAERSTKELKDHRDQVLRNVREVTEYFHGDMSKEETNPLRIFVIVRDFLGMLDRACKEVGSSKPNRSPNLVNKRVVLF